MAKWRQAKYHQKTDNLVAMTRVFKVSVKFLVAFFLATILCTVGWQYTADDLYDCTDPVLPGYLEPGSWVHAWGGHPMQSVSHVSHGRDMGEPDTIRAGWSTAGLWWVWSGFLAASLVVSFLATRVGWRKNFAWWTDWLYIQMHPTVG